VKLHIETRQAGEVFADDGQRITVDVVQPVHGFQFSREAMSSMFTMIANKEHWKYPIDAVITEGGFNLAQEAALFFAGSALDIVERLPDGRVRVQGPGYFNCIGA
jgi:hypothetical protein